MRALLLLLAGVLVEGKRRQLPNTYSSSSSTSNGDVTHSWDTYYFDTRLDNFDFTNLKTFQMRYLVNTKNYKTGGPIFFYSGNEGAIEDFANETGLMWDLAPTFNAAVILGEHRYYGHSMPYGDYDKSYASADTLAYFSSEQALADYAALLQWLRNGETEKNKVSFSADTKVITFGESYGGMLAAWFRIKYPHVVDGAYASSAPVLLFNKAPGVDVGGFDKILTDTYRKSGCDNVVISKSWDVIRNMAKTAQGRSDLNDIFKVDKKKSSIDTAADADDLIEYISEGLEYMAIDDISYPVDGPIPMPASPVKYACDKYLKANSGLTADKDIAKAMAGVISVYYNYNQYPSYAACFKAGCGPDQETAVLGSPLGWPWQSCTEIVMTMCAKGGQNDFFWNECGDDPVKEPVQDMYDYCGSALKPQKWTNGMLGVDAVGTTYGFSFKGVSNIIMTNGDLDPWRAGGVQKSDKSRRLFAPVIANAPHHFDLRQPNTCDPSNLAWIRYQAVKAMKCFIDSAQCPDDLDIQDDALSTMPSDTTNCKDIVGGYPWGQKDKAAHTIFSFTTLLFVIANVFRM